MTPSPYQQAIYDAIRNTGDNLSIQAVAGSGKTTTLIEAFKLVPAEGAIFLAFNKAIADELQTRGVRASTLHSLGYRICQQNLGFCKRNDRKLRNIWSYEMHKIDSMTTREKIDHNMAFTVLEQIVSLCKSWGITPSKAPAMIPQIITHYDIDTPAELTNLTEKVVKLLEYSIAKSKTIDFDDMIYWPAIMPQWTFPQFSTIFVDEAQDLNHAQRIFISRLLSPTGRIIVVGDSAQAIYGFRGAASDSMVLFGNRFNTRTLPLSVCYRCGSSIVKEAQRLVPVIEPWEGSPVGNVLWEPNPTYNPGDMVVCRNVQPLIELATTLLKTQPVRLEYPELISELLRECEAVRKKFGAVNPRTLAEHSHQKHTFYMDKGYKRKAKAILEKIALIRVIADRCEDFVEHILQVDLQKAGGVRLLSIHKAKGLEANRVILLRKDLLPSEQATADWELEQEKNLEYVAITRARKELVYA